MLLHLLLCYYSSEFYILVKNYCKDFSEPYKNKKAVFKFSVFSSRQCLIQFPVHNKHRLLEYVSLDHDQLIDTVQRLRMQCPKAMRTPREIPRT